MCVCSVCSCNNLQNWRGHYPRGLPLALHKTFRGLLLKNKMPQFPIGAPEEASLRRDGYDSKVGHRMGSKIAFTSGQLVNYVDYDLASAGVLHIHTEDDAVAARDRDTP